MNGWIARLSESGADAWMLLPLCAAFAVSIVTSMGGVSGAVLLLPFQVSVLGCTGPSASATNFVYNLVAVPGGVLAYLRERRMAWPLVWTLAAGTLPGVFLGFHLRTRYLPDPAAFRVFAGCVLLGIGAYLLGGAVARVRSAGRGEGARGIPEGAAVRTISFSPLRAVFEFRGERFSFSTPGMFALALAVGVVGGTYGIGGGAIVAPFCVAVFRLPIHAVAGATLLATFLNSAAGVAAYGLLPVPPGIPARPDVALGLLLGAGGLAGTWAGARLQRFVPARFIRLVLGAILLAVALEYLRVLLP